MPRTKSEMEDLYYQAAKMLNYCPDSGNLYWKEVSPHGKVKIGDIAGCKAKRSKGKTGSYYVQVVYMKVQLLGHRLCWLIHYGCLVEMIDHIDGDPANNKLSNLRSCTNQENSFNRGKNKNNTSGYKGVSLNKSRGKYQAKIYINNKSVSLGYFLDPKDAHLAYVEGSSKYHGEFARAS